jgi:threonine/homoserine/homoserine lactone efflux protein
MIEAYLALLTFILFMVATPGPANLLVMIGGAQQGVATCMGFVLGLVCGKACLNLVFGLGFGLFLADQPLLANSLKFVSAGYMIWLALQSWNDRAAAGAGQSPFSFRHGVIVHPLNPKAWVMVILAWSQFAPALGPLEIQLVLVTAGFAVIQVVFHTMWCFSGALLQRALPRSRWLSRSMILMTVAVVIWALFF